MKLYDEIRLAVREGKKCLPYLIITALMFAIVSAVASCLFLTAVNLRRDYYDYLDKQPHSDSLSLTPAVILPVLRTSCRSAALIKLYICRRRIMMPVYMCLTAERKSGFCKIFRCTSLMSCLASPPASTVK